MTRVDTISLRPLRREDFPQLAIWLAQAHVVAWWGEAPNADALIEKYAPRLEPNSATLVYIIQKNEEPIGIIQCYRHADYPDYDRAINIERAAGIDYLIGEPSCLGQSLGSAAISAMVELAFAQYKDVDVIVSAPQKENRASWRALEKADFKRICERKLETEDLLDGVSYIYGKERKSLSKAQA